MTMSQPCLFCRIAAHDLPARIVAETGTLVAFLDIHPIRPGHVLIVPREHFAYFDDLPRELLAEMAALGQQLARAMKEVYGVARVGFAFTGTDVPHVHAHVVPLVRADDLTSRRYIVEETVTYRLPETPPADEFGATLTRLRDALAR